MAVAQKILCRVNQIEDHGKHVYTVGLIPDRKVPIFKPGQFLHLALDSYDPAGFWPESRVFSVASPPQQRDRLSLTYSVRGRFTARMEKELAKGKLVWIKMPYGEFIIEAMNDVVLLAGGTGITAFTAFLSGLAPKSPHKIYLAYGARNNNLLIYRNLIDQHAREAPHLRAWYFVEEEPVGSSLIGSEKIGMLSIKEIWGSIDDPLGSVFYLSGPPGMIHMLSSDLKKRGIRNEAIRVDAWE